MQNRYTGDIGDFAKYGILRELTAGQRLGVAWYLYPDESHNADGKHTAYLHQPEKWRHLDPDLFDALGSIAKADRRNVRQIEQSGTLGEAAFSATLLDFTGTYPRRAQSRVIWFNKTLVDLEQCDIVFADPDNGLCADEKYRFASQKMWKRIPLSEAHALAKGRTAVIYHHNTRRPGGHALEIQHWLRELGPGSIALYWRPFSPRTYFIANPTSEHIDRANSLARNWSPHLELYTYR
jgi:hypothetical protein